MRDGRCTTENANPSPTSLLFLGTARLLRGRKLLKDHRFGLETSDYAVRLSTNVDNRLTNCGQVRCEAIKGCLGEVVHSTYSKDNLN